MSQFLIMSICAIRSRWRERKGIKVQRRKKTNNYRTESNKSEIRRDWKLRSWVWTRVRERERESVRERESERERVSERERENSISP